MPEAPPQPSSSFESFAGKGVQIGGEIDKAPAVPKDNSKDAREARILAFKNKHMTGNAGYDM